MVLKKRELKKYFSFEELLIGECFYQINQSCLFCKVTMDLCLDFLNGKVIHPYSVDIRHKEKKLIPVKWDSIEIEFTV